MARSATWDRQDRDLLIELRTTMQNVQNDIADARGEIKEINTGITARLLNLESNSVSKIQLSGFENRIFDLEAQTNQWLGKQNLIAGGIGIIAGLVGAFIQAGKF
jgi:hypothetical protein